MPRNFKKSILMVVITAVLIIAAAPTIAAASVGGTTDSCDSSPHHEKASMPLCCLIGDCPLTHCILSSAVDNNVLLPGRFIPNKNVHIALSKTSVPSETSLNPQKPFPQAPVQELPLYLYTEYRCRNCLNSEDPYQI